MALATLEHRSLDARLHGEYVGHRGVYTKAEEVDGLRLSLVLATATPSPQPVRVQVICTYPDSFPSSLPCPCRPPQTPLWHLRLIGSMNGIPRSPIQA